MATVHFIQQGKGGVGKAATGGRVGHGVRFWLFVSSSRDSGTGEES